MKTELELHPVPSILERVAALRAGNKLLNLKIEGKKVTEEAFPISKTSYVWNIKAEYLLDGKKPYAWWALYRGVMPAYPNSKNYIHYDWCYAEQGHIDYNYGAAQQATDYESGRTMVYDQGASQQNSIFTLALFIDESRNEYRLAEYVTFHLPFVDPKSGSDIFTDVQIIPPQDSTPAEVDFQCLLSAVADNQWWSLYKGVMPSWADLNRDKVKWDWLTNADKRGNEFIVTADVPKAIEGEIYTLALYRDILKNDYDLADYKLIRILNKDVESPNLLSDIKVTDMNVKFHYKLSRKPDYQWWVIFKGVMPSYNDENRDKVKWDWLSNANENNLEGDVQVDIALEKNGLYTLALFIDSKRDQYSLGDFKTFRA